MASWRGTIVADVIGDELPLDTTHLFFESEGGYRACLDVYTALNGLLAVTRDGDALSSGDRPRLVCPGIEGGRTVKGVSTIEAVVLAPETDPTELEALDVDE